VDFFNHKVEEITGYLRGIFDSRRLKWLDIVLPEDIEDAKRTLIKAFEEDQAYVWEYRIKFKDGTVIWIQERSHIVLKPAGKIDHISGVFWYHGAQRDAALATTGEIRDPYTAGHQEKVVRLARAIAKEMGLPEEQIEGISVAGALHDIGKISVPAEILSKPGKLSEIEFQSMAYRGRGFHKYANVRYHPSYQTAIIQVIYFL
jgi:PAS domain S-box-containing protein